jgi:chaperonin GroES
MNFRMSKDLVLIECEAPQIKWGNLVIPEQHTPLSHRGTVLSVGEGYKDEEGEWHPMDLEPGMDVLFTPWENAKYRRGDKTLVITRATNVLVILRGYNPGEVRLG